MGFDLEFEINKSVFKIFSLNTYPNIIDKLSLKNVKEAIKKG